MHGTLTDTVAGTFLDLKTVGKGFTLTEVDEVGSVTNEC
jgi:hypothetical protein